MENIEGRMQESRNLNIHLKRKKKKRKKRENNTHREKQYCTRKLKKKIPFQAQKEYF